ncbi:hypothetical protein APB47_04885, partial [Pseudomonas aeruginosa]
MAGCFIYGDHHHERSRTGRYRSRQAQLPSAWAGQVRTRGLAQEDDTSANDAIPGQPAELHGGDG